MKGKETTKKGKGNTMKRKGKTKLICHCVWHLFYNQFTLCTDKFVKRSPSRRPAGMTDIYLSRSSKFNKLYNRAKKLLDSKGYFNIYFCYSTTEVVSSCLSVYLFLFFCNFCSFLSLSTFCRWVSFKQLGHWNVFRLDSVTIHGLGAAIYRATELASM